MRSSGLLLHLSSLPTEYGIGTMGKEAKEFIDFLYRGGQTCWQMLPIGPTSFGDSPYQSFSTFAGNPYFIDLTTLSEEGLLERGEFARIDWGKDRGAVDYGKLFANRFNVLHLAYRRGWDRAAEELERFRRENEWWLEDYSLYMSLKEEFQMRPWYQWPEEIRARHPDAMENWRLRLQDRVRFWTYLQYQFQKQWDALHEYAREKKVELIGDLPMYVSLDSADAWANPEMLQLDENLVPRAVAGVPPDAFTADGQLWGNPIYDWNYLRDHGYDWWVRRIGMAFHRFDRLRLDHFRGFESYYAVPYGDETARNGHWEPGPGMDLFHVIRRNLGQVSIIAEDLGFLTQGVYDLMREAGYPGMKVLQFAFDHSGTSNHLPHCYQPNTVVYTGTHDNDTTRGWAHTISREDCRFCYDYLGIHQPRELCWGMLRCAWASVADLAVAPVQDLLELNSTARMNTPGTSANNWQWRLKKGALNERLSNRLYHMTRIYSRCEERNFPFEPEKIPLRARAGRRLVSFGAGKNDQ